MSLYEELVEFIASKLDSKLPLNHVEKMVYDMYYTNMMKCVFDKTRIINMDIIHYSIQTSLVKDKNYIIKLLFSDTTRIYINYTLLNEIELFKDMLDMYEFNNECVVEIVVGKEIDSYNIMNEIYNFTVNGVYKNISMEYRDFYDLVCVIDYMGPIKYKENNILVHIVKNKLFRQNEHITLDMVDKLHTIFKQNNIDNGGILSLFMEQVSVIDSLDDLKNRNVFRDEMSGCSYADVVINHKIFSEFPCIMNNNNAEKIFTCLLDENTVECWDMLMNINLTKGTLVSDFLIRNFKKIPDIVLNYNIELFSLQLKLMLYEKYGKNEKMCTIFNNAIMKNDINYMVKEIPYVLNTYKCGDGDNFRKLTNISCTDLFTNNRDTITQIIKFMPLMYKKWCLVGKVLEVKDGVVKIKLNIKHYQSIHIGDSLLINYKLNVPYNICKIKEIFTYNAQKNFIECIKYILNDTSEYYLTIDAIVEVNDNIYI